MGQGSRFSGGRSGGSGLGTRGGKIILQKEIDAIIKKDPLLKKLVDSGTKINVKDVLFTTKDKTGMVVWLEKSGLSHILDGNGTKPGHAQDFQKAFGISREKVSGHIKRVITRGKLVKSKLVPVSGDRMGYERIYYYKGNHYLVTGIGSNGYIVSAYPCKIKK